VPIEIVDDPATAQVQIRRRRPPLRAEADGRMRASHGRAILQLRRVLRDGSWHREPAVEVLLSPGQRSEAMEATALHELGHAFGLWGHSDDPGDAMAAVPGAQPVRQLSPRDRATVAWLYRQPSPFGGP
jgi:predicted Zn-dependent protease